MACALIGSLPLNCRDSSGGIKELKWKILPSLSSISSDYTLTSGVVTIAVASRSLWYTITPEKRTASFTDVLTSSLENGTLFSEQSVKLIFNKLTASLRNELVLAAAQNRLQVAIRDNNDNYWLLGLERGLDIISATANSGTSGGDRNGFEVELKGQETSTNYLVSMTSATYNTLVT